MDEMKKEKLLESLRVKAEEYFSLIEGMELPPETEEKVNQSVTEIESQLEKEAPDLDTLKNSLLKLQKALETAILPRSTIH